MRDALWKKAFWSWFGGLMAVLNFDILPLTYILGGGPRDGLSVVEMILIQVLAYTALAFVWAWFIVARDNDGIVGSYQGFALSNREWLLRRSAQTGRRVMLYLNPVGLLCIACYLFWHRVLVPVGGTLAFVHRMGCLDDDKRW